MKKASSIKLFLLLSISILLISNVYATEEGAYKKFDEASYEKATKGVDYQENIQEREEKEREPVNFEPPKINLGNWSMMGDLFKGLLISSLILLLAYIIFRIFDANYIHRKVIDYKDPYTIDNLEQHIHEVNLKDFLAQALQEKNFKLAVRIYYLIIIKELSDASLINWKKQKTNGEYLSEMFGHKLFPIFRKNTTLFERVWYGDIEINSSIFKSVQNDFDSFINQIPKKQVHGVD